MSKTVSKKEKINTSKAAKTGSKKFSVKKNTKNGLTLRLVR